MPLEYALQFRGKFSEAGPWKLPVSTPMKLSKPLGITELPTQKVRRSKRYPYTLNIMVAGESGMGKTTFMNTLFCANLSELKKPQSLLSTKTVAITPTTYELVEQDVTLKLTVIDTPGFGDRLNRNSDFLPIAEYIEDQFELYRSMESTKDIRKAAADTRVHAVIYFLPPTGKLKDLDIEALTKLSLIVNVIPVIAKSDTMTVDEIKVMKQMLLERFAALDIRTYPADHAEDREKLELFTPHIPFAIVSSDEIYPINGKKVRGRQYRWGIVEVENPKHCDFVHLRELLIRENLQDLIETTHTVHYARYRGDVIRGGMVRPDSILECDETFDNKYEDIRRIVHDQMRKKEEEIKQNFVAKVREKEVALKEIEEQLNKKRQMMLDELEHIRKQLEAEESAYQDFLRASTVSMKK